MHETAIAAELAGIVLSTAEKEKLALVSKVNISFGELIQIVPHIFESAFREAVKDTIAGNAELIIEVVKVRMKCKVCSYEFSGEENVFMCPVCGSADAELLHGRELFVNSIEGEHEKQ